LAVECIEGDPLAQQRSVEIVLDGLFGTLHPTARPMKADSARMLGGAAVQPLFVRLP
jgi:hypothetical protein